MLNECNLIGNLGDDVEVRQTTSGVNVANMRLATNEKFRDKDGNVQSRVEWHRVSFFNVPEKLVEYLTKGRQLLVKGKLETRKWEDKDGMTRYSTSVVVRPGRGLVQLLGSRQKSEVESD